MYDFIYNFVLSTKYVSIFLLMVIFPTETIMPIAGYAASLGHVSLPGAILAGTAGTTLWAVIVYAIARKADQKSVHAFIDKHGPWLGLSRKKIERAGKWFDRHARATVFIGRLLPGARTAVSVPAGFRRMPFWSFVTYTALGSGTGSTFLAYVGYIASDQFERVNAGISGVSGLIGLCVLVAILAYWLWRRVR